MSQELQVFDDLKTEISKFVAPVRSLVVNDFQSSAAAVEVAKQIKSYLKQADEKRKEITGPLNDRVKSINDYVKQLSMPLADAENHVMRQLNAFAAEQERARREKQRLLEEEQRRAAEDLRQRQAAEAAVVKPIDEDAAFFGVDAPDVLQEQHKVEQVHLKTEFKQKEWDADQQRIKNTRSSWKAEIADLSLIPKEFLIVTLNEAAAIAAHKAGVTIPGVKFTEEFKVAIGAKTRVPRAALGE